MRFFSFSKNTRTAEMGGDPPPCNPATPIAELEKRVAKLEQYLTRNASEEGDCARLKKTVEAQEQRIKELKEKLLSLLVRHHPPPVF